MPIVSGNEPPQQKPKGIGWGWIIPLIIFGRPVFGALRNALGGRVTDQQLMLVVGGVGALILMVVVVRRINSRRDANTSGLPTAYTAYVPPVRSMSEQPFVLSPPRFEPIITGKVLVAGVVLGSIMLGAGLLLLAG